MGCRTLTDQRQHEYTCFYDSVTMTAFGPVMGSDDEAEAFMKWLEADKSRWSKLAPRASRGEIIKGGLSCDPRNYADNRLRDLYTEFRKGWDEDEREHAE